MRCGAGHWAHEAEYLGGVKLKRNERSENCVEYNIEGIIISANDEGDNVGY